MTAISPRRAHHLALALATTVALTSAAVAQTTPDTFATPETGAPQTGIGGDTAAIDMREIDETRLLVEAKLKSFAESGQIGALIADVSAYSDATVAGLGDILDEGGDPCTQAVRAAVYLDGHLEEADWAEVARGIERPWEMAGEIIVGLRKPDENDILSDLISKFWVIDRAMDTYEAYKTVKSHYVQTPLIRDGIASNQIVQEAVRGNWTEADIQARRADLLKQAQGSAEEMLVAQARIKDGLEAVDKRYDERVSVAFLEMKREIEKVYGSISIDELNALLDDGKFPNLRMTYDAAVLAAGELRAQEHQRVVEQSYALMQKTQFATEQALAQVDALARYSAPLARGDCAKISRDGPVSKPEEKPDSVTEVLALPHDKLLIFLTSIGSKPSEDMLNCLCHIAGYGSPGTAQFYHPDTLGTYDKRYSCQHPGDPCIVSGYGCLRHPLPSDPQKWVSCAATTGEDITGAIVAAVKARKEGIEPVK